ncbi:hypothetical protein TNCT_528171 [Trichonephila clavata]|uniref:Uncharacterized protein n=1 Tax=Trichonephila clavata TaxID=2740835 RepID=A0A8X6JG22_TRICU|nr:hypothetical protein TNCT_528171 [Trichonephila clavata]
MHSFKLLHLTYLLITNFPFISSVVQPAEEKSWQEVPTATQDPKLDTAGFSPSGEYSSRDVTGYSAGSEYPTGNIGNNGNNYAGNIGNNGNNYAGNMHAGNEFGGNVHAGNEFGGDVHGNGAGFGGVSTVKAIRLQVRASATQAKDIQVIAMDFLVPVTVFLVIIMDFLVQTKDTLGMAMDLGPSEGLVVMVMVLEVVFRTLVGKNH